MKTQLRALCDNQSLTDVFATFEENVARLVRENETLRQINLQLEARELDAFLRQGEKLVQFDHMGKKSSLADASNSQNANTAGVNDTTNSESFRLQASKKENLRLLTRLKKSGQDREVLKVAFEELKTKERQFIVNTKIANDASRRLRIAHQQLIQTKRDLENEITLRVATERDLQCIREDTATLRTSEAALKEERMRYLSELASLRERVREVDHERKRMGQLNRFVQKHATEPPTSTASVFTPAANVPPHESASNVGSGRNSGFSTGKSSVSTAEPPLPFHTINPYRAHIASVLNSKSQQQQTKPQQQQQSSGSESAGTVGVAGLSNGQYLRLEESDGIEPSLEVSLAAMHESIIASSPTLLPLFRKLTSEIHTERTRALQKRSQLLSQVYPRQYQTQQQIEHQPQSLESKTRFENMNANRVAPGSYAHNTILNHSAAYAGILKSHSSAGAQQREHDGDELHSEELHGINSSSNRRTNKTVRF